MKYDINILISFIPATHRGYASDIVSYKSKERDEDGFNKIQLMYTCFDQPRIKFIKISDYNRKLRDQKLKELGI